MCQKDVQEEEQAERDECIGYVTVLLDDLDGLTKSPKLKEFHDPECSEKFGAEAEFDEWKEHVV